eukprot:151375-Chlamydomonas_euryale.AAC.1
MRVRERTRLVDVGVPCWRVRSVHGMQLERSAAEHARRAVRGRAVYPRQPALPPRSTRWAAVRARPGRSRGRERIRRAHGGGGSGRVAVARHARRLE